MVLSLAFSPPPKPYPPSYGESMDTLAEAMANLAESMAKLEVSSKRLAASTANLVAMRTKNTHDLVASFTNLVPIGTKTTTLISTFTTNESDNPIATTKTDIIETTTEVNIETTPPITDINTHNKTLAPFLTASTSSLTKIEKEVETQSQTPISVLPTLPANPNHDTTINPHATAPHFVTPEPNMIPRVRWELVCFKDILIYFARLRCKPHAPVFLRAEPKPPWRPHQTRYKAKSLEDKTRFEARSIDTCLD